MTEYGEKGGGLEGCYCLEGESPFIEMSRSSSSGVLSLFSLFAPQECASGLLGIHLI